MQMKKILICSASMLALVGVASETSTVQASSAKFTGELCISASGSQQKTKAKVSSSAISSKYGEMSKYGAIISQVSNLVNVVTLDSVMQLIDGVIFSNTLAIIDRDNSDSSITAISALDNYGKRLSSTAWTPEKSMTLGGKVSGAVGIRVGSFAIKAGAFVDFPLMNKKVNLAVAKSSTSSNSNTNNNANANTSSTSNSKVSLDMVEEKGMTFGGMGVLEYSITDRFTIGSEFGMMRIKNSYDLSKPNKDLLGIDGIPTGVDAKGKTEQNSAFNRSDEYKTYNKVEGTAWVPYFALRFAYNFNKCFSLMFTAGYKGGADLKLTSSAKEIKNPDYNISVAPGFCGSLGIKISI